MAELNCTRKPRLTCTLPASSTQGTRNWMTRSGSTIRWRMPAFCRSGRFSTTGWRDSSTSPTAWRNSGWLGSFFTAASYTLCKYSFLNSIFQNPFVLTGGPA